MVSITKKELKTHQDVCYICEKRFLKKFANYNDYLKVSDRCYYSICNLKFDVPNEITVDFRKGSNYDYHFIIKELAKEFEGKFECFGENTEKYKTFQFK